MAIFCENCGAPNNEHGSFCVKCGTPLNKAPTPPLPTEPAPDTSYVAENVVPQNPWVTAIVQNFKLILLVISAFALMVGLLNLFGTYEVSASTSLFGSKVSTTVSVAEMREDTPEEAMLYVFSSYVLAIACIGAAGLGGYSFYLTLGNNPDSRKFFLLSILVGLAGSILALLMALLGCHVSIITLGIHFTYFLMPIVFGGLLCMDKLLLKDVSL